MNNPRLLLAVGVLCGLAAAGYTIAGGEIPEGTVETTQAPYIHATQILAYAKPERLRLHSQVALVMDEREGVMLYGREIDRPRPIASLTKLMSALVVLESGLPLDEPITITEDDRDRLKGTRSRLPVGAIVTRDDLLRAALAASDNRAAAALARSHPGGTPAFVAAMNAKAAALGMTRSHFADASGLNPRNVSTARDLVVLAAAAHALPRLHVYSTRGEVWVTDLARNRPVAWNNTNRLVRNDGWDISLSKTGYTADAGNCLVLQTVIGNRPVSIVLLNSQGKLSKYGDARRIRDWLLDIERRVPLTTAQVMP